MRPAEADTWHKRGRFQLRMDARTETELGTLRGYAAINFNWATGSAWHRRSFDDQRRWHRRLRTNSPTATNSTLATATGIEHAYVELGGFRIGVDRLALRDRDRLRSGVVNDGLISYGPFTTHQIAYTFDAGNGFSVGGCG